MVELKSNNNKYFTLFKMLVFGTSILIILRIVDLRLVASYLKEIPLVVLILLLAVNIFRSWLTGLRWMMLNPDPSGQLSRWDYFRFVMIAFTYNLIMPGALGGDFVKAALTLNKVNSKRIDNILAILIDRFIGFISIIMLGTIALILSRSTLGDKAVYFQFTLTFIYVVVLILIAALTNQSLLKIIKNLASRIGKFGTLIYHIAEVWSDAVAYFIVHKIKVLLGILICIPIHLISFITAFILAHSLDIQITFIELSLIISLVWVISAIPVSLGGVGIRELSLIYFFSIYGIAPEPVTALAAYIYIIVILKSLIGLVFIVDWKNLNKAIILKVRERFG